METLGKRLEHLRKSKKMTAVAVKEITGVDNLGRYEKDERKPTIDTILSLAKFYNVSIDWLLTGQHCTHESTLVAPLSTFTDNEVTLLALYAKLNKLDQACILERIKTIIDIKGEATLNMDSSADERASHNP